MAFGADIAELIVALRLDDSGFSGKLNRAAGQLRSMDRGLGQMGRGLGQVSGGLLRMGERAAIAAGAGLTAVVTTAASFEQAFTGVEKTVDGTEAQLAELEETIRGMARTMPVAFEELAGIGEAGGALGVAREDLDEFIDVVARLAVSTDLSSEQAATALGQLGTVLDLSGDEFESFADTLVALGNAGASTESQIVEMAARFAAAGNSAGLSSDEILALSSALASMGIEVEAGGSSLSRLFNNTTTNIGVANAKAEAFAEALGLTFDEFKEAWDRDALGTFEDLLAHLNTLDQFEAAALLKRIGITNTRDVAAIGLMAQNVEFLGEQLEITTDKQGALGDESDKFFATTQSQWKILINNVRDAGAVIGSELLPIVNELIGDFVGFLAKPGTQSGLKDFAKDLAEGVRGLVTELKGTDFSGIIGGLKLAAEVAKGAFDAFRALPQPIQQLAIAALVANKVSGGAVGQIAKGLGNILFGGARLGAGLFGGRGTTPANPLFVSTVGGGLGGGGGLAGGKGGGITQLLGGLAAFLVAAPLAFGAGQALAGGRPWWDQPAGGKVVQAPRPKNSRTTEERSEDAASFDRFGAQLEELATKEVIQHLARTNEIGLKGVGTTFQVGIADGLDPIGDIATQILARAEDPKAPPVMREIQGHLSGLEEIQATYLAMGDVALAAKVQTNIDTLHTLIGTTDSQNAILQRVQSEAVSADAVLMQTAARQADLQSRTATASEITASKDFNPEVNVHANFTASISIHDQQRVTVAAIRARSATGFI